MIHFINFLLGSFILSSTAIAGSFPESVCLQVTANYDQNATDPESATHFTVKLDSESNDVSGSRFGWKLNGAYVYSQSPASISFDIWYDDNEENSELYFGSYTDPSQCTVELSAFGCLSGKVWSKRESSPILKGVWQGVQVPCQE